MNPRLKPLNHKQVNSINPKQVNNVTAINPLISKNVLGKQPQNAITPQNPSKKFSNNPINSNQQIPSREIKTPMKMQRTSTKKVEMYDHDDDFECELQDNNSNKYFESQLQKNIKQEAFSSTKKQPQNKALIVLPKLESEIKVKGMKDLEKQIDLEMSRFNDKEDEGNLY